MIVVKFMGGFANQLFQLSLYLKLQECYPENKVFADISHYKKCKDHGGFKLQKQIKLNYYNKKIDKKSFFVVNENNFKTTIIQDNSNYYFNGYWQDEEYFPADMSNIYSLFSTNKLKARNLQIIDLITNSTSVSLHVRRGDYINNFMHGNIANEAYFQNSIEYINKKLENPTYFIFSDDLEWCKANLKFENKKVYFVDGNQNDVEQDLILMSCCKHNIISNSSFSWWAAFLNKNENKIIVKPEYWFNQLNEVKDLIVRNSIEISNILERNEINKSPFFSIIIPVHNSEGTIKRTFESILNQTNTNFEVIVINDSSTDNSETIINQYKKIDKRINLINMLHNSGSLSTRIEGVKKSQGKYIIFLDSDDWFEKNALEVLYNELTNNPVDILEFGYIIEPERIKHEIQIDDNNRFIALLKNYYPGTLWNKVYKKELVTKAVNSFTPFYSSFAEDAFFSIVIAYNKPKISYISEFLYHYNRYTGISTQKKYSMERFVKITNDVYSVIENLKSFLLINKEDPELLSGFVKNQKETLLNLAKMSVTGSQTLQKILYLDDKFKTDYFSQEVDSIYNKFNYYEEIINSNIKFQIKFAIIYFIKKIKDKILRKNSD